MARYKAYDYFQGKYIPIDFDKQILPGAIAVSDHHAQTLGNQGIFPKTIASKAIRTKTPFLTCLK